MAKILAVDDQRTIRELVTVILGGHGHEVDTAENGMAGLVKVKKNHYDLIISDVNMPRMDGISFVGKVRTFDHCKYIPILMLTTESSENIKLQAKESGASGWLTKPFDSRRLASATRKLLAKAQT
jgi:two-component system chemotaxis response regulator CheY